jgi:hypothetical protein
VKAIRERTGLAPNDLASHVNAPNGAAIIGYENGTDMPASVLNANAKLFDLPLAGC